ncbi:MAG: outer membrane protein assembly factor BamD [Rickettsiales bacterium]|nr:outer membrane protein assembly factor BamD [Rickettsiales bacterium]
MNKKLTYFLQLLIALTLINFGASCSKKEEKSNAEISYSKAVKLLKQKNYNSAAEAFIKIDDDYPFSKWALKGQIMAVFAYYKEEDYPKLVQIVDDFLRLNPANENVPYMLYMKGLSYYNQIPEINRAQDNTHLGSSTFRELIARFPNSFWSEDAKKRLIYIDEHLAGEKMSIGRYQISQKNYTGAINNFVEVTERYRFTNQVPEAYFRLIEIYYKIGLNQESIAAFRQLKLLFPQNNWTKLAKKIDPVYFDEK